MNLLAGKFSSCVLEVSKKVKEEGQSLMSMFLISFPDDQLLRVVIDD